MGSSSSIMRAAVLLAVVPLPLAHPNSPRRLFPLHSAEEVARLLEELRPAQESSLTRLLCSVVELVAPSCVVDLLLPLMKLSLLVTAVMDNLPAVLESVLETITFMKMILTRWTLLSARSCCMRNMTPGPLQMISAC